MKAQVEVGKAVVPRSRESGHKQGPGYIVSGAAAAAAEGEVEVEVDEVQRRGLMSVHVVV